MFKAFWLWLIGSRINLSRGVTSLPFGAVYTLHELMAINVDWDNIPVGTIYDHNYVDISYCSNYYKMICSRDDFGNHLARISLYKNKVICTVYYYNSNNTLIGWRDSTGNSENTVTPVFKGN